MGAVLTSEEVKEHTEKKREKTGEETDGFYVFFPWILGMQPSGIENVYRKILA